MTRAAASPAAVRPGALVRGAVLLVTGLLLGGCSTEQSGQQPAPQSAPQSAPQATGYAEVAFVDDLDFGAPGGIRLDVCLPEASGPTEGAGLPAVISVHGGGWTQGDKGQRLWRDTCAWLASEGFVVFQPNYRLAPTHPFPAAADDLTVAIEWIRADGQVERFGHDPGRLGAFGDSAGGNLVALLGTRGDGDTHVGTRVSAVVALSAPLDLTRAGTELGDLDAGFQRTQLDYLGCESYDDCPIAEAASPTRHVDATDPPFFLAHSTDEFVPVEQAENFVGLLEAAGVEVTYTPVPGSGHALDLLDDDLRDTIAEWLQRKLAS